MAEENIKNDQIETAATNTITYKGSVTIKRIDKKGRIKSVSKHNEGKQGLFNFLLYALAYNYQINKAPYAIMGYTSNTEFSQSTAAFSRFIIQNNAPVLYKKTETGSYQQTTAVPLARVEYSFLVPASVIKSTSNPINFIRLVNTGAVQIGEMGNINENDICAEINLEGAEIKPGNDNLLIYWDLEFESK